MGRKVTVFLILAVLFLQDALLQQPVAGEARKPFFERFRRLEEQFRRFQEVTLLRLQEIAGNYNVSYNIDARFEQLWDRQEAMGAAANASQANMEAELNQLKSWAKRFQRKAKKQEVERREQEKEAQKEHEASLLANLTQAVALCNQEGQAKLESLQKVIEGLQDALKVQGSKIDGLERQLKESADHNEVLLPSHLAAAHLLSQEPQAAGGQRPALRKLRAKHRQGEKLQQESVRLVAAQMQSKVMESGAPLGQEGVPKDMPPDPEEPPHPGPQPAAQNERQKAPGATRRPGTICNVGSMLVFPNNSTESFASFGPSFLPAALLELSLCGWVHTGAGYLGTILSYATEENDNKLVLHGRDAAPRSTIHFVIGDPAFQELPVGRLLDGAWHHFCVIWSSLQGRYWFYVDRRVVSVGSHFRKGYEIPSGGSLILGQEQDSLGGGFEASESFVGSLAGLALWDRALTPGEVSGMAIGNGVPRGPLLTLANVSTLHGSVKKVECACLEHCL
uniref:Pentraxin (PTX) domain-containing protein n=1 Tax=Anolis carolinensis TaxID=28377 RepID=H9GS77_ANOCA|nr:PREDICTED: pentraxin-4 [Anolis carolinensis]|eukprot:XP_008120629.1 PREDICTED: pentraxin-4 [Anolis carolinensis]